MLLFNTQCLNWSWQSASTTTMLALAAGVFSFPAMHLPARTSDPGPVTIWQHGMFLGTLATLLRSHERGTHA